MAVSKLAGFLLLILTATIFLLPSDSLASSTNLELLFPIQNTPSPVINPLIMNPEPKLKETPKPTPSSPITQAPVAIPSPSGPAIHVPIIYYHYIGNNPNLADKLRDNLSVTPDKFDQQMAYLASNGYTPITLDTLYATLQGQATLPSKPIVLTFDDGYIDFYINAFGIIRKYNFHVVSFIPTGLMDQSYYLRWNMIKEMDSSGLVSFQAHSISHANLATLPPDQVVYQIVQSKKDLEEKLGHPVNFFAYPYGASNSYDWQVVKKAGFLGAVGTWYGTTESDGNLFDMPRIKIAGEYSLNTFASKF